MNIYSWKRRCEGANSFNHSCSHLSTAPAAWDYQAAWREAGYAIAPWAVLFPFIQERITSLRYGASSILKMEEDEGGMGTVKVLVMAVGGLLV